MKKFSTTNYIDPGTGSVLATSLWTVIVGALAVVAAFFAAFYRRIKEAIAKLFRKDEIK